MLNPWPAFRSLRKSPQFAFTAVLLIAIGLAASTTAFTVVHTLFFQPRSGIEDPGTLFNLHPANADATDYGAWSWPDFLQVREQSREFTDVAAFTGAPTGVAHHGRSESVDTQLVSANFFKVVGVRPELGRFFAPEEDGAPGGHPVAVVSHRFWQTRFDGDASILGQQLRVNGELVTIIGVAAANFHGTFIGFDFDLWLPLSMARVLGAEGDLGRANADWLELLGRLAPGSTAVRAQTEIQSITLKLRAERPASERTPRVLALPSRPIDDSLRGAALGLAGALAAVAGLVLVIACLNVGGLLLTRAEERRREHAVRLALGASRGRLLSQWLVESVIIFALGGLAGLLLSLWIADLALLRSPTPYLPLAFDFAPDWRAFAFCFGAALSAGLLTGLVPGFRSALTDVVRDLKLGGHGATGSTRLRHALVVAQIALSLIPLVIAGLFTRTLHHTAAIDPGFSPDQTLVTALNLAQLGDNPERGSTAATRLLETARSLPGVESAALASRMPLGIGGLSTTLRVDQPVATMPASGFPADLTYGDAEYFETLRIPLLRGRGFTAADRTGGSLVTVVSATLARQFFGTLDVVGRELRRGGSTYRIVGVARDVSYRRLWETPRPQFYLPLAQHPRARLVLAVRTSAPAASLVQPLFDALRDAEPDLPISPALPGSEQVAVTLFPQKLGARVATVLGIVCLGLAAAGLYAVLALGAVRQQREFGVRVALGAQRHDILSLVFRRIAFLAGLGALFGGLLAFVVTRVLRGFLHGVAPFDPSTYLAVLVILAATAALASWLPARRAAHTDPVAALRAE